jgi:hypothetical protein
VSTNAYNVVSCMAQVNHPARVSTGQPSLRTSLDSVGDVECAHHSKQIHTLAKMTTTHLNLVYDAIIASHFLSGKHEMHSIPSVLSGALYNYSEWFLMY